jgi:hypothetical protein
LSTIHSTLHRIEEAPQNLTLKIFKHTLHLWFDVYFFMKLITLYFQTFIETVFFLSQNPIKIWICTFLISTISSCISSCLASHHHYHVIVS